MKFLHLFYSYKWAFVQTPYPLSRLKNNYGLLITPISLFWVHCLSFFSICFHIDLDVALYIKSKYIYIVVTTNKCLISSNGTKY